MERRNSFREYKESLDANGFLDLDGYHVSMCDPLYLDDDYRNQIEIGYDSNTKTYCAIFFLSQYYAENREGEVLVENPTYEGMIQDLLKHKILSDHPCYIKEANEYLKERGIKVDEN